MAKKNNNELPPPCVIVIFGASGDLTQRKLVPSLYDLCRKRQLHPATAVVGVSRTKMSDDEFRDHLKDSAKEFAEQFDEETWNHFAGRLHYHPADSTKEDDFPGIKQRVDEISQEHESGCNVLFYLSVAPHLYEPIINRIGDSGMVTEGKAWCSLDRDNPTWQRIIVEKPFGFDPDSAGHLLRVLGRVFEEESIYRIDHYLGKETVQNVLVFRFANAIFEPIWNCNYIDHVQVTAMETVGVGSRGGYYDSPSGGAMRDMIQSHLMQLMALIAMEPPTTMDADHIRLEKAKVLSAIRPFDGDNIARKAIRGQYGSGSMNDEAVKGYREEQGVDPQSQTETYAAVQFNIDTWRWGGVPFYLRSGKRMPEKLTQIVINFKPTPHILFRETAKKLRPNQIIIDVQPNEGIRLRFEGKVPGSKMDIKDVVMDFDLVEQFNAEPPEAYATLLLDAMRGDQTLFKHREEIEWAWHAVQPVLDYWDENPLADLPNYAAGTWGPSEADVLMAKDGRHWHNPT